MPKGIYIKTKEHRRNLSLANKGKNNPMFGKSPSEETKLKMSLAHKGKKLSERHRKKLSLAKKNVKTPWTTGSNNWNWKGGRRKTSDGYILILSPYHLNRDFWGYVFEHRLVMEKKLGRYLTPEEIVHHLDSQKDNNKLENLHLFPNKAEHNNHHKFLRDCVKMALNQNG